MATTTALLHYCTTALLHCCTTALLHYCTTALLLLVLHYCSTALLHYLLRCRWDTDDNHSIDKKEFHRAVRGLGFEVSNSDCDQVFATLDEDGNGSMDTQELMVKLKPGIAAYNSFKLREERRGNVMKGNALGTNTTLNFYDGSVAVQQQVTPCGPM